MENNLDYLQSQHLADNGNNGWDIVIFILATVVVALCLKQIIIVW